MKIIEHCFENYYYSNIYLYVIENEIDWIKFLDRFYPNPDIDEDDYISKDDFKKIPYKDKTTLFKYIPFSDDPEEDMGSDYIDFYEETNDKIIIQIFQMFD